MRKLLLFISILCIQGNCEVKLPYCQAMSDSYPITIKESTKTTSTEAQSNFSVSFNPLILPVTLRYDSKNGFTISHSTEEQIVTPLGVVGIHYSLSSVQGTTINGYKVSSGDFVVGLVDNNTQQKQVFKIEGYSKLKVVTEGKTTINAEEGYVEIDVTDAKIRELKFVDNSKFTLVNTTNKKQNFLFGVKDAAGTKWNECEIEPLSYKFSDIANWVKSVNKSTSVSYLLKVENDNSNDDSSSSTTTKITFGEVCQILADSNGGNIRLEKKTGD